MPAYAGIGSRETPEEVLDVQRRLGLTLANLGWTGRSGNAPGSDKAYYHGALQSPNILHAGFESFLPWSGFEDMYHNPPMGRIVVSKTNYYRRALCLGIGARGTDRGLKIKEDGTLGGGFMLHGRNPCQILGRRLDDPVRFVSCYAKPIGKEGKVSGGTNTAVALALHLKIDVANLYLDEYMERALQFLKRHETIVAIRPLREPYVQT